MLERDVDNMTNYYAQYAPQLSGGQYAKEIWALYEEGELHPDTVLTGIVQQDEQAADVDSVMDEIKAAFLEQEERLRAAAEAEGG